jgi:hypothetical protein
METRIIKGENLMINAHTKTGSALQCQSRRNTNPELRNKTSNCFNSANGLIWQHKRVQIRFGLPPHHAKLICQLSGLGGAANDA